MLFKDHDLPALDCPQVRYERRPVTVGGRPAEGIHAVWITLDNPAQLNSYTTEMVKGVILGVRRAANDRAAVAVVFTGAGDRAFCTGGNTREYAEYYAGRPDEYRQYMRLFNDMVTPILECDKPVICRVNGMRIGGGPGARHGLRLHARAGPRAVRPGRASPRLAPPTAGHRLPAAVRRHRARDVERARSASRGARTRRSASGSSPTSSPGSGGDDGAWVPNPLVYTDGATRRVRPPAPGRAEGRRRAGRRQGRSSSAGTPDLSLLDQAVDEPRHRSP
jgi:6-oxo-cyclohex-1-ene-carbonyl-CoA hydrolase